MSAVTIDKDRTGIDDINAAIAQAQQQPVEFKNADGVKAFLVSAEIMEMVRARLKLIEEFNEHREQLKNQIGDGLSDDELKEMLPDYDAK